ncbi:MAG: CvpA family protein [bacterium]|nr:CvpA family protein [bacterium]
MNGLDITFLIILSISAIMGLWKGITRGIFSLIAVVAGVTVASRYYCVVSISIHNYVKSSLWSNILSFFIVFIVIALIISLIGVLIKKLMGVLVLGWIDHLGGLIFGIVKGVVISGAVVIIMEKFPIGESKDLLVKSILCPYILESTKIICYLLPKEFYYSFKSYLS